MKKLHSFRDLIVWQRSMQLACAVYGAVKNMPREELYGLTSQIRRAAVSIPSNIAEGRHRGTRKEFAQFLRNAYGSGAELETQIELAKLLGLIPHGHFRDAEKLLNEVMRMLNAMLTKLHPTEKLSS